MKNKYILYIVLITSMSGLLFGYDTGVIADALVFINKEYSLTIQQQSVLVSILPFGAFIGSLCSGILNNKMGRRRLLFFTAMGFIVGTLFCSLGEQLNVIIFGRFIVGIAIGIASFSAPLYISEIAPANFRGGLVIMNTVMVTGGILLAYILGYWLANFEDWRSMFAFGLIPAIIFAIGIVLLPGSPRWLIQKNLHGDARIVLKKLRGTDCIEDEVNEIEHIIQLEKTGSQIKFKSIKSVLSICMILAMIQQTTGINAVLYYAPEIFKQMLKENSNLFLLPTIAIGATNFFMTIVAMCIIDKFGRRNLLLYGLSCMAISLMFLAYGLNASWTSTLLFFFLIFYIASYALSIGCIFWLLIAEISPLYLRAKIMSIAAATNWITNLLVSMTALTLFHSLGVGNTFMIYAFFSTISIIYCYFYVKETQKISLEKIEQMTLTENI